MWSNESTYPELEDEYVYPPVELAPDLGEQSELAFESVSVRTDTEWDSHYVRFTYRSMRLVAELNFDAGPYVNVQHDSPCTGLGVNEHLNPDFKATCAQTGREEHVHANRSFSIEPASRTVLLWGSFEAKPPDEEELEFGKTILGQGLTGDEYLEAARLVTEGLLNFVLDSRGPWWPIWNARSYGD